MKKYILVLIFLIQIKTTFSQSINPNSKLSSEILSSGIIKSNVLNYITSNLILLQSVNLKSQGIEFDFEKLDMLFSDGVWTKIITCNSTNKSDNSNYQGIKFTLGFIMDNNKVISHHICKTTYEETTKSIELFNDKFEHVYMVNIDDKNKSIDIKWSTVERAASGCGQSTMNCINHHYTNNGWWSVGLWTVTLFYPGAGVAVAAACGVTCCTNTGCPGNH